MNGSLKSIVSSGLYWVEGACDVVSLGVEITFRELGFFTKAIKDGFSPARMPLTVRGGIGQTK